VGLKVGFTVGVNEIDGALVGFKVGLEDGAKIGLTVGEGVGLNVGNAVGV
jgi:hypothetical protein